MWSVEEGTLFALKNNKYYVKSITKISCALSTILWSEIEGT